MSRKPTSDPKLAAIAADYAAGATYATLIVKYRTSQQVVSRALFAHGITPRPRGYAPLPADKLAAIADDYAGGMTYDEIREKHQTNSTTIRRALSAHGVKARKRGGNHERVVRVGLPLSSRDPKDHGVPRAFRVHCERERRPCVVHDLPDACKHCDAGHERLGGIVSTLLAEGVRLS